MGHSQMQVVFERPLGIQASGEPSNARAHYKQLYLRRSGKSENSAVKRTPFPLYRCRRYHDFRDTPISKNFSGILFGVAECRICDFAPTPSLFPLFPMYQVTSVSIYKSLIHRKTGKSEGVDRKGDEKHVWLGEFGP
jgi:hypothetical protein